MVFFATSTRPQTFLNGIVMYHYSQVGVTETAFVDGTKLLEFPNGQVRLIKCHGGAV